jgi:hypothetical protein
MFTKDELMYLLECVENISINTTQMSRNKAHMSLKLCDLIDAAAAEELFKPETTPAAPQQRVAKKKKVARKKK